MKLVDTDVKRFVSVGLALAGLAVKRLVKVWIEGSLVSNPMTCGYSLMARFHRPGLASGDLAPGGLAEVESRRAPAMRGSGGTLISLTPS